MPTILHVVHSVEPGGTERMLCRLVSALDGVEANHIICSLRDPRPFGGTLGDGLEIISLSAKGRDRFLYRRLGKLIRDRGVDLVHARNWGTWTDATLACRSLHNVQLLLGFHGLQNGQSFTTFQRLRAKLLNMDALAATAVSNAARDVLVDGLGFNRRNVRVIHNGVNSRQFAPASDQTRIVARHRLKLRGDRFIIGSVANFFERVKGHDVLLRAFARIVTAHPNAHLILVGYGPLESELRSQVKDLGLCDRVTFTGRVERVERILPAFDVFVCSSHSEGLSNAVLEAMAVSLPCVVTDVSDHRQMFDSIDPDLIIPPNDDAQMATSISRLMNDPNKRSAAGLAARSLVETEFTFDACSASYARMYDQLLTCSAVPA
ncbi:MAG: glycosyltransferase [Planctomycetes bacterium]|nr:glycosyltransferase [Planctomycetota bacterium]